MKPRYGHILIATDFSEMAEQAVVAAADIAQRSGAELTLAHVFDPSPYLQLLEPRSPDEAEQAMGASARKELDRIARAELGGVERVHTVAVRNPSAAAGICDHAAKHDVDLIVVGTRGRTGLVKMLLGSVAARLVRHAPCDVLVIRGDVTWPVHHIVAPTDLSDNSSRAVEAAGQMHGTYGGKLSLLHVLDESVPVPRGEGYGLADPEELAKKLHEKLEALRAQMLPERENVEVVVRPAGSPIAGICDYADDNDVDLVVVATHGRTGLAAMLIGSVSEHVVQESTRPVLVVRSNVTPPDES